MLDGETLFEHLADYLQATWRPYLLRRRRQRGLSKLTPIEFQNIYNQTALSV